MSDDMSTTSQKRGTAGLMGRKKTWCAPVLSYVGHIGDVLQGGGGKLSPVMADSGDIRKPSGQE